MGRWGDGEMGRSNRGRFFTFGSGVGNRESGVGKSGKLGELSWKSWCILIDMDRSLYLIKVPTRRKKPTLVSYSLIPKPYTLHPTPYSLFPIS
ncbi:hypothetical protein [Moorena sp. SIO3H5]|uniref:hypothetical protein n=1 Tax=Moorena sp. SIO3H5 TaxID=2607834 RepID=UPI0013BB0D0F|nr:hypothetical protein [Moorena sp. SIO3H5]NEO71900.1 hypothetical protein [Moorena sp. SIO3H5]